MDLLAYYQARRRAADMFHYAQFGAAALVAPAGMPAFQTLALNLLAASAQVGTGAYLLDNRPNGGGYVYGGDTQGIESWVNGGYNPQPGLAGFCTDAVQRLVLECHDFTSPTLLSHHDQFGFLGGPYGEYLVQAGRYIVAYTDVFTPAEKAATSGPFPTRQVLARWDLKKMTATTIPDVSGHGYHLTVAGQAGTLH